jgi:hypothetical protein
LDNSSGQTWYGNVLVKLAAAGVFGATVDVTVMPLPWYWNATSGSIVQTTMSFHDQMETITVAPRGTAQQQSYQNQDLSLTLFILFFASVDIAVTLYDHSYDAVATKKDDADKQKPQNRNANLSKEAKRIVIEGPKDGEHQKQANGYNRKTKQAKRKKR